MLLLSAIREGSIKIIENLTKRGIPAEDLINSVLSLDKQRRACQMLYDNTLSKINKLSKEVGVLYQAKKPKIADELKKEVFKLKENIKTIKMDLDRFSLELESKLIEIPNAPHSVVPAGSGESDNEILFEKPGRSLNKEIKNPLPHWELAVKYNLIDFETGSKITGSGFPLYLGKGARLQRALINYFLDKNIAKGYLECQPPHLINKQSGIGTGQLPDKDSQMYHTERDGLYLIPTAEVPVTNIFRDSIYDKKQFPICYTAYTPCFRREAGSYGAHVRGLNRLHQFDKVEIVRAELPENSYKSLDIMIEHIKEILEELALPYRLLRLCAGDLGFAAACTYDFEVFSVAQKKWLEVSSVSNFETFQSNRLKFRYKDENNKTHLAHTLNGSSLALPRVLASILENYQTNDSVCIPDVLQRYTGFSTIN